MALHLALTAKTRQEEAFVLDARGDSASRDGNAKDLKGLKNLFDYFGELIMPIVMIVNGVRMQRRLNATRLTQGTT